MDRWTPRAEGCLVPPFINSSHSMFCMDVVWFNVMEDQDDEDDVIR